MLRRCSLGQVAESLTRSSLKKGVPRAISGTQVSGEKSRKPDQPGPIAKTTECCHRSAQAAIHGMLFAAAVFWAHGRSTNVTALRLNGGGETVEQLGHEFGSADRGLIGIELRHAVDHFARSPHFNNREVALPQQFAAEFASHVIGISFYHAGRSGWAMGCNQNKPITRHSAAPRMLT